MPNLTSPLLYTIFAIFSETFIETHKNVSILYADICNFTPLTEKFTTKKFINGKEVTVDKIEDLVATLNDLFTKFDDAAEVKFLVLLCLPQTVLEISIIYIFRGTIV